jgi:hypothetical protein
MNLVRFLDLIFAINVGESLSRECRVPGVRHAKCDARTWRNAMSSRTLGLALLFAMNSALAEHAQAQENLDAGKSPSQIFAGTCTACHKSPRGLMKTVSASSLPGFLRQHYTTSSNMAGVLSSYLISNGAADTRYAVGQPQQKGAKDGAKDATHEAAAPSDQPEHVGRRQHPGATASQEAPELHPAARPDADGTSPQAEPSAHLGRNGRQRLARPTEAPDVTKPEMDSQTPPQATVERGPDGRRLSPKRLSKRGKAGEELPKIDVPHEEPASVEPVTAEPAKTEAKGDADKVDSAKPDGGRPAGAAKSDTKSDTATVEPPKEPEMPALRVDPVPLDSSAPAPSAVVSEPPATTAAGGPETPTTSAAPPAPAVTASTPATPPVAPAGPPAPPISQ